MCLSNAWHISWFQRKLLNLYKHVFPSTNQLYEISGDNFVVPDLRKSGHASENFCFSCNEGIHKLQVSSNKVKSAFILNLYSI